jgi:glycine/D-amino acid oxidase-like deaminating enzyme/nitrite reductase/ring-hydroxylating ferredoxin subunit
MKTSSGTTVSSWMDDASLPSFPALGKDREAEVCIVGGGIAGLTVAYLLAREGRDIILLEARSICAGETSRTTAHLSFALDEGFVSLEKMHGEEGARKAAQSHAAAITTIEKICQEEGIDCELVRLDGYLFNPPGEEALDLQAELEAAQRAGIADVQWADKAPMPSFDTGRCLRFPRQGQFHPLRYMAGLARAIVKHGGTICEGMRVNDVQEGERITVKTTAGKSVRAKWLVVATNPPVYDNASVYTRQSPYRTYVVGLAVPKGSIPEALYWDTLDPYHYVRIASHDDIQDVLIVGGEDHKTGQENDMEKRYAALEEWTRKRFPEAENTLYRWSGQVMEPVDGLAMIGHEPGKAQNVLIATGDSGHGMTHGTLAGMILSDHILGRENPWKDLYAPSRMRVSTETLTEFVTENANVAKEFIGDHIGSGDVSSPDDVKKGCGALLREGTKKIALYRDDAGTLHRKSAICPHLGCVVHWNDGEKSWDCPCHGSRYSANGEVLSGPTMYPLTEADAG